MAGKEIIARNFSRYAYLYDRYANIQRQAALELADLLPHRRTRKILEVGCGTGQYTLLLADMFRDADITALDISANMIEIARQKLGRRVEFIDGDAENYTCPCRYDLITSNAALQWFDDIERAMAVYRASLAEGGVIAFSAFGPKTFCELDRCIKEAAGSGVSISTGRFRGPEDFRRIIGAHFEGADIRERIIVERYGSLMELLNKIRYTGTRGYGAGTTGGIGRMMLDRIEDTYMARYGEVSATYQVFYCVAVS